MRDFNLPQHARVVQRPDESARRFCRFAQDQLISAVTYLRRYPSFSPFLILPAVMLGACGDGVTGTDNGLSLSGTVTAPPGLDVMGTEVAVCTPRPGTLLIGCDEISSANQTISIESEGTTAPFRFTNLAEESYLVRATLDVTDDDFSDFWRFDCNPDAEGICQYYSPPIENLDLTLEPPHNDFRVRVFFPDGFDPLGIEVAFCIPDEEIDQVCDEELSSPAFPSIAPTDPEADFWIRQIDNFAPGDYVLLAGKDTDGDDIWDFWSCYFGNVGPPTCAEVSPGSGTVYDITIVETTRPPPFPYGPPPEAASVRNRNAPGFLVAG